jgi:hypothetical protein
MLTHMEGDSNKKTRKESAIVSRLKKEMAEPRVCKSTRKRGVTTIHKTRAERGMVPMDDLLASIRGVLKKTAAQREREIREEHELREQEERCPAGALPGGWTKKNLPFHLKVRASARPKARCVAGDERRTVPARLA